MKLDASVGLVFNGDCEAAFAFYAQLLGAKAEIVITWGASPLAADVPRAWHEKVLFARLIAGPMTLTGADAPPGAYRSAAGFNLRLSTADETEAERAFAELAAGGVVQMPLEATFFAHRYGEVVDRFGVPWEIQCRKPPGATS
jgi:PhnB protein